LVVWMVVVGDVVVERCLRSAAIVKFNWGKWIGFCDEITSARDFLLRVPSFPRAPDGTSLLVRYRDAESTRIRAGVSSFKYISCMRSCRKILHDCFPVDQSSLLYSWTSFGCTHK
jgi:hypothetical protein